MIPINVDSDCTKSSYPEHGVLVSSIFYTLQGEGVYTGHPFIFIRLAGCNFGSKTQTCSQCDTSFQLANAHHFTTRQLLDYLTELKEQHHCENIVLTGGEPTLQRNILDFMVRWVEENPSCLIQIETNGTQPSFFSDLRFTKIRDSVSVCCSPKCNEVTKRYTAIHKNVLLHVDFFKYLLSADEESCYHNLPDYFFETGKLTYISPITVYKSAPSSEVASIWDTNLIDGEQTSKNYAFAAQKVLELQSHGQRTMRILLSLQTHLFTAIP